MKVVAVAVVVCGLSAPVGYGQVRGTASGSAEAQKRLDEHKDRMRSQTAKPGELNVAGLKVGTQGRPQWIDAKVMQVIDKGQMIVGLEDSRTGDGGYRTWIMLKCPTKGITDGESWRGGEWKRFTGSDVLKVTGTTTYKTVAGGTRTVFVVEPTKDEKPAEGPPGKGPQADANSPFAGRWRIVDEKGRTATHFTLTDSFQAKKSHAPDATGKWEIVDGEARITWSDGWKDVLRPEKGRVLKIAFGPGTSWKDPPANTQRAIKEPRK